MQNIIWIHTDYCLESKKGISHWFFKIFVKKGFQSAFWFKFNKIHWFWPIWILFVWLPVVQIYFVRFQVFRCRKFHHFFYRKSSDRDFDGFWTSQPIIFRDICNWERTRSWKRLSWKVIIETIELPKYNETLQLQRNFPILEETSQAETFQVLTFELLVLSNCSFHFQLHIYPFSWPLVNDQSELLIGIFLDRQDGNFAIEFNSWKDLFAHCFIVVSRKIWMNSWNQVGESGTFKSFYKNEVWEVSFTVNLKSFFIRITNTQWLTQEEFTRTDSLKSYLPEYRRYEKLFSEILNYKVA